MNGLMAVDGGVRRRTWVRNSTAALTTTVALASLALAGCGGSDEPSVDAAPEVAATAPATDAPTTSIAQASSTTTIVLPQPVAPPLDEYGVEPVIEVGWIEIPAIDVVMTMYEGIRLTTLDYGPGHWPGSAMPGQIGNTVIAGHRTSKHKVFRNLDQLVPGDEIIFDGVDGRHVYHVTGTEILGPEAMWIVDQTPAFTATLFACHPPGSTRERIVVYADLAA